MTLLYSNIDFAVSEITIFYQIPCQAAAGYNTPGYSISGYSQPGYEDEDGYDVKSQGSEGANNSTATSSSRIPVSTTSDVGSDSGSSMTPNRGKILMVLPPQQYQEEELNVPSDYFQSQGFPR